MEECNQKKLVVLASGRGSNFQAILSKIEDGVIPARVSCVISDNPQPPVFQIATAAGIPTHWVNRKQFSTPGEYAQFFLNLLEHYQPDLIVLAGFLKLIPTPVVRRFAGAIINIHPALLPNFGGKGYYGLKVHEAVLAAGVKVTGVTIHFVDEHYDTGAIIYQEKVPVLENDTPETLAARVLQVEHRAYPQVIKDWCEGRFKLIDRKVVWQPTIS
jgi:formyltetrahydrofolate-dependent phosphoribosylglycinamide formyltransferase